MARRRNRKPRWTRKTFFVCLGLSALMLFPLLVKKVPTKMFKIRQLEVLGLSSIPTVDFQSIFGIQKGDPLMGKWLQQSVDKVAANPRVANISVSRDLTGKVQVFVKERKSVAIVNLKRLYYIDDQANLLGVVKTDSKEAMDLPVITGPWNQFDPKTKKELLEALDLKNAIVQGGTSEKEISELHLDDSKGWVFFRTGSPINIVMGRGDFVKKITRLRRVFRDFQGREQTLVEVDLDFADRAIVKKAELNNLKRE